jgi:hypothetical protein
VLILEARTGADRPVGHRQTPTWHCVMQVVVSGHAGLGIQVDLSPNRLAAGFPRFISAPSVCPTPTQALAVGMLTGTRNQNCAVRTDRRFRSCRRCVAEPSAVTALQVWPRTASQRAHRARVVHGASRLRSSAHEDVGRAVRIHAARARSADGCQP